MFSFLYLTNPLLIYRSVIFCGVSSIRWLGFSWVFLQVSWPQKGTLSPLAWLGVGGGASLALLGCRGLQPQRWSSVLVGEVGGAARFWYYVTKKCIPYQIFEREMLEEKSGKVFWEMYLANHNQSTTWNSEIVFEKNQPSFPNNKLQLKIQKKKQHQIVHQAFPRHPNTSSKGVLGRYLGVQICVGILSHEPSSFPS